MIALLRQLAPRAGVLAVTACVLSGCSDGGAAAPEGDLLAFHDFDDGSLGPYLNPWGGGIDFPQDPTSSGLGRVARITYSPPSGQSQERAITFAGPRLRYGETIWMRGDVYLQSSGVDPSHNRKLVDYQGNRVRMTLHRRGSSGDLRLSIVDAMRDGIERETIAESTGLALANDRWHTLVVRITTNTADGIRDGVIEVFLDDATSPGYRRDSGLGWITEKSGGTYFDTYMVGFQLTIDSGDPAYTERRYWDNVAFGRTRPQGG